MTTDRPEDIDLGRLPFFAGPTSEIPETSPVRPSQAGSHLLAAAQGHIAAAATSAAQPIEVEMPALPHRPRPATQPEPGALEQFEQSQRLDWDFVGLIRKKVSERLATSIQADPGMSEDQRLAIARTHITENVQRSIEETVAASGREWTAGQQDAVQRAVFDSLFRLGRLQPLLDLPGVENVDVYGHDNVWVTFANGNKVRQAPVAGSDAELIAEIQFLATRDGEAGRSFNAANPILDMDLPGGARLAAVHPPIAPRPKAVIRVHRFVDITLDELVTTHGTLTRSAADLLRAAIEAGKSIVASGHPGAGKTTLIRALANCIQPLEKIVTIEKERELYLERMGDRHLIVTSLQYRPGQGERQADGSRPGEVTLVDCLEEALRLDAQRIIVGEVRGGEIDAMFQAMQAGVGSLSTLHASSPTNAIERMATLTQKALNTSAAYAYRQITQHIDLVVQISRVVDQETGQIRRLVTEISEILPGESVDGARPIASPIFRAEPRTLSLRPVGRPTEALLEDLKHHDFDDSQLLAGRVA